MPLNKTQEEAVNHFKGPMMVLAGPGSGKTMVITHRTQHLIEKYKIPPHKILVITFTKAAAEEMKERFLRLNQIEATNVTFGTFHSVFFRILRKEQGLNINQILHEDKKYFVLLKIIKSLDLEYDDETDFIQSLLLEMSYVKNEMISLEHYHSTTCGHSDFHRIVHMYETYKEENHLIDFDDMLVKCYDLLLNNETLRGFWQQKYEYILVDEFQDINRIQYENIKLLAQPNDNLFVVGDDDQAIYEFRGAKPDFLLSFPKDFKDSQKIILNTNYRSTQSIIKASLNVISHNQHRYEKALETPNTMGIKPLIMVCDTVEDEVKFVLKSIEKKVKQQIPLSQVAIIYRTHVQARFFIERLMDLNLPFTVRDQLSNIYNHWIAKDFLAYLTLTQNIKDKEALTRIINKPKRYVNKETIQLANKNSSNIWEGFYQSYNGQNWMIDRLEELQYHIQSLKKLKPFDAIQYIRKQIGYDGYLNEYAEFRKLNSESLIEIGDELEESAKPFESLDEWLMHIEEYTEELKNHQVRRNENQETLTLTTMHSAKGLEFHTVYLAGCNEGIIPHDKSNGDKGIEEERRLFYVGMTRAKEDLIMTCFKERYNKKLEPSRFIGEYKLPIHQLVVGAEIKHQQYGVGRIEKINKDIIYIYFSTSQKTVKLSLSHCKKLDLLALN